MLIISSLTGRATHIGQLFYHTAMCLLAQINPQVPKDDPEMSEMKTNHAHEICAIVAHSQDRGIASAAIRCLAIGAECLTERREQEEVLEIFKRTREQTGWRVDFISKGLKEDTWKWPLEAENPRPIPQNSLGSLFPQSLHVQAPAVTLPSIFSSHGQQPPRQQMPSGIMNPMYTAADFSHPNGPYKNHYTAPSQNSNHSQNHHNNYQ